MKHKVLIVDDEKKMCRSLQLLLEADGRFDVETACSAEEGMGLLKDDTEVVITDLSMPGMDGLKFLKEIKKNFNDCQVIIMTAYSTVSSAIEAIKNGAFDYLTKPFSDERLLILLEKACEIAHLRRENRRLREGLSSNFRSGKFIGRSLHIQSVFRLIEKASQCDSNVLITGESGTGKELVAHSIHSASKRATGLFIALNCTAIPDNLLESELFGYEKGAFTGAVSSKAGRFELAHNGTLFLDEIGDMSTPLQAKLLRFLETREFERVGGLKRIKVDARIIASTNRDLEAIIKDGRFREDLYYRLNVIHIHLLPLRERREDISPLIAYFTEEKCRKLGYDKKAFSNEALDLLLNYSYPGNVRELENIIESSIITSGEDIIYPWDLPIIRAERKPDTVREINPEGSLKKLEEQTRALERRIIEDAINKYRHLSNEKIAEKLGVSRRVLETRMKMYRMRKNL